MFTVMSATAVVIIFMTIYSDMYQDNLTDKRAIVMEDYGYSLQNEFLIADEAKQGYERTFEIPYNLEGFEYDALIINNVLVINFTENMYTFPIPDVQGVLQKGDNKITKKNNTICVNC